eukprot:scaffold16719_cov52-Attheya_sp.AAC.5
MRMNRLPRGIHASVLLCAMLWILLVTTSTTVVTGFGFGRHTRTTYTRWAASSSASALAASGRKENGIPKDVVVVGGGLAGLSAALRLATVGKRQVTVLEREGGNVNQNDKSKSKSTAVASFAAAGMLAPNSERLPSGPLLDLCLASRRCYDDFVDQVESLAKDSGTAGYAHLIHGNQDGNSKSNNGMRPWEVGYSNAGGFLAPAFAGDSVATWAPPPASTESAAPPVWLDSYQIREMEPALHPTVVGGWWFPEDASIDARRLTDSLRAACVAAGVHLLLGPEYQVDALQLLDGTCHGIRLASGQTYMPQQLLVANGAWMRDLLPVPITPHKGQSFSVLMPPDQPPLLSRVLFAQDTYIVPKADGRIVVGATVEPGTFDANVTPAGLLHCMNNAIQLVPGLKDLPLDETWAGLRPTTPDKGPILGHTPWSNVYIAGGYWRNGVLLAPKTAQLLSDLMTTDHNNSNNSHNNNDNEEEVVLLSEEDRGLLKAFAWDRFTELGGGKKLAANARYAASMHPVHGRSSTGIAASVGTELGFYSGAGAAKEERQKDRLAFSSGSGGVDDAFERAAQLGKEDATAFTYTKDKKDNNKKDNNEPTSSHSPQYFQEIDAYTVGSADSSNGDNMSSSSSSMTTQNNRDQETLDSSSIVMGTSTTAAAAATTTPPDETTYDGYQVIENAATGKSFEERRESMRQARIKNRLSTKSMNEAEIGGVMQMPDDSMQPAVDSDLDSDSDDANNDPLKSIYENIQKNKAAANMELELGDATNGDNPDDERPDPGFRIYRVDPVTGEGMEVPPFTKPEEFEAMLASSSSSSQRSTASPTSTTATLQQPQEKEVDLVDNVPPFSSRSQFEDMIAQLKEGKVVDKEDGKESHAAPSSSGDYLSALSSSSGNNDNDDDDTILDQPPIVQNEPDETTFDGYQDIQNANQRPSREEELKAMKEARQKNRMKSEGSTLF